MIVADTDVLVDFLRDREPAARLIAFELEHGDLKTTAVNRFELLAGARNPSHKEAVLQLLAAVPVLPLDAVAADRAAVLHRGLEERGETIGMADSLIAGIVLQHGGALLTRNRRHFERVPGLRLEPLAEEL